MSLFERIKNKRYDLQEKKKRYQKKVDHGFNDPDKHGKGGFEDITGEGIKKGDYPSTRKELEAKRKYYEIDPKTNQPSKAGIEKYARKHKQLSSGSNIPVKLTQADLDKAKRNMVGGEPFYKMDRKGDRIIGTTTGKIGGRLANKRSKNAPSYAEVKKKIDAKNPVIKTPIGPLPKTAANMKKYSKKKRFTDFTKKTGSKVGKFALNLAKKNPLLATIAVGAAGIYGYNKIRKALTPGQLTRKDFSPTKAITDTKGKKIRFKYDTYNPATKSTTSAPNQAGPTITKSQLGKFERDEYNVKDQFGKKIDLNKRIQQSAFTKQLKDASKGTGFFGRQTKKDQKFLQKYKKAAEYRGIKVK